MTALDIACLAIAAIGWAAGAAWMCYLRREEQGHVTVGFVLGAFVWAPPVLAVAIPIAGFLDLWEATAGRLLRVQLFRKAAEPVSDKRT